MARTLSQSPERTNRMILYGAIALAALAAVLIFFALNRDSGSSTSKAAAGDTTVVVASANIAAGTKITDDLLSTTTIASKNAIAGVLTDRKTAVGLTAVYPIAKGEQISSAKVLGGSATAKTSPSYIIPPGKRAFAVPISLTTSANQLLVAGDHVDVIAVGKQSLPQQTTTGVTDKDFPASITLFQNIEVLAVQTTTLKPVSRVDANGTPITSSTSDGSLATNPDPQDTTSDASVAVLSVDPAQAQALAVASEGYKIYLSLRPPGDTSTPLDPANIVTLPANLQ